MGMANKYFYKGAKKVFVAFEHTLGSILQNLQSVFVTGNPIRDDFYGRNREQDRSDLGLRAEDRMLLVMGGELGTEHQRWNNKKMGSDNKKRENKVILGDGETNCEVFAKLRREKIRWSQII